MVCEAMINISYNLCQSDKFRRVTSILYQLLFILIPEVIMQTSSDNGNSSIPESSNEIPRQALLGSITNFNKAGLKRCRTTDKSAPRV